MVEDGSGTYLRAAAHRIGRLPNAHPWLSLYSRQQLWVKDSGAHSFFVGGGGCGGSSKSTGKWQQAIHRTAPQSSAQP